MSDKAAVIGQIRVELIKKHGKIERVEDNLITGFGKSFVLANGLANIFRANTSQTNNKADFGYFESGTYGQGYVNAGPYFKKQPYAADMSRVVNLLLDSPTLVSGQGVYLPKSAELMAYAYADSGAGATQGIIADLKDGTQMRKCLTRRYVYGTSVSGQFNTIATLLTTPDGATGRIGQLARLLSPGLSTDAQPSSLNLSKLLAGKIMINMSDSSVYEYDMTTGVLTLSSGTWTGHYNAVTFIYKDNLYILYNPSSSDRSTVYIAGYDSTGNEVLAPLSIGSSWNNSSYFKVWYDSTTDKVYLNTENTPTLASTFEFTTSSDIITGTAITSDSITIPTFTYKITVPVGEVTDNIYSFGSSYGLQQRYYLGTDGPASTSTLSLQFAPAAFMINNRLYAISGGYVSGDVSYQTNSSAILIELGNLLSYHTFSVPFIKDVGDELYVSYSYYID